MIPPWVFGIVAWLFLSFLVFYVVATVHEDKHHWDWTDDGPGAATNVGLIVMSLALGALPFAAIALVVVVLS